MSDTGRAPGLGAVLIIVVFLVSLGALASVAPLYPQVSGVGVDRGDIVYFDGENLVVSLYTGFQAMFAGGEGYRVVGYKPIAACSTRDVITVVAALTEPYLMVVGKGSGVKSVYLGGEFAGISCGEGYAVVATVAPTGLLRVGIVSEGGDVRILDVEGLREMVEGFYNTYVAIGRFSSSIGGVLGFGGVVVEASGNGIEGVWIVDAPGGQDSLILLGSYSGEEATIVYGSLGGKGFAYNINTGSGFLLAEDQSRVVGLYAGDGRALALVEIPGSPLRILTIDSIDSMKPIGVLELSIGFSYVLKGHWVAESGVWISVSSAGRGLLDSLSLSIARPGFGVVEVPEEEGYDIARLRGLDMGESSYTIMKLSMYRVDYRVSEARLSENAVPTLPPLALEVYSVSVERDMVKNFLVAIVAAAPWAAIMARILSGEEVEAGACNPQ